MARAIFILITIDNVIGSGPARAGTSQSHPMVGPERPVSPSKPEPNLLTTEIRTIPRVRG